MEGYRRQEPVRAEALKRRAEVFGWARADAEKMMQESRDSIQAQVQAAKAKLASDAREMADGITASILRRTA